MHPWIIHSPTIHVSDMQEDYLSLLKWKIMQFCLGETVVVLKLYIFCCNFRSEANSNNKRCDFFTLFMLCVSYTLKLQGMKILFKLTVPLISKFPQSCIFMTQFCQLGGFFCKISGLTHVWCKCKESCKLQILPY